MYEVISPVRIHRPSNTNSIQSSVQNGSAQRKSIFDRLYDPASYTGVYAERFRSGPGINHDTDIIRDRRARFRGSTNEATNDRIRDISAITRPYLNSRRSSLTDLPPSPRERAAEKMRREYERRMRELSIDTEQMSRRMSGGPTDLSMQNSQALDVPSIDPNLILERATADYPFDADEQLQLIFQYYCRFGRTGGKGEDQDTMDNSNFAKFCRECPDLMDSIINSTEIDIVFTKVKEKGKRRLTYSQFLDALAAIASAKFPQHDTAAGFSMLLSEHVFQGPAAIGLQTISHNKQLSADLFDKKRLKETARPPVAGEIRTPSSRRSSKRNSYTGLHSASDETDSETERVRQRMFNKTLPPPPLSVSGGFVDYSAPPPVLSPPPVPIRQQKDMFPTTPKNQSFVHDAAEYYRQNASQPFDTQPNPRQPIMSPNASISYAQYRQARQKYAAGLHRGASHTNVFIQNTPEDDMSDDEMMKKPEYYTRGRSSSYTRHRTDSIGALTHQSISTASIPFAEAENNFSYARPNRSRSSRRNSSRHRRSSSSRRHPLTYNYAAGVATPRFNGSGSIHRSYSLVSTGKKPRSSVRRPSTLGTSEFIPTVAGEANRPGDVYDRLANPSSFTGVYRRAYLTDGRINHFADTGVSAIPTEYVGDTNTSSNEVIHDIRYLLRPNLQTGPSFR